MPLHDRSNHIHHARARHSPFTFHSSMHSALIHQTELELEQGLSEVLASPRELGRLEAIFVRPKPNERVTLTTARLTPEAGIQGDRWAKESHGKSGEGQPDLRNQISLMNSRFLRQIAGDEDDALCLAGDNLIVDLDLSAENLPAGARVLIGSGVVIEFSDLPHTGCSKLAARYGDQARAFINNKARQALHLRGRYGRVVTGGTLTLGDEVRKL